MATATTPAEQKLTYVHSKTFSLKEHPGFDEGWLEKQIREHPEILGLGSAKVVHSQIQQKSGGRVDLLLKDADNEKYYTVELMLGPVDASHIVRTIDYFLREETRAETEEWDHVAVLVAEDIRGSRFSNVVEYLSQKMPLIVMELSALRVGDYVTLKSVPIFDRTQDSEEGPFTEQDEITRESWIKKSSRESVELVDRFGEILRKLTDDLNLTYKSFIGVAVGNRPQHFVYFSPKREFVRVHVQQISNLQSGEIELAALDSRCWKVRKVSSSVFFLSNLNRTGTCSSSFLVKLIKNGLSRPCLRVIAFTCNVSAAAR